MAKHLILLFTIAVITIAPVANSQSETQKWECAIDLHQGDTGTLSLDRTNDSLQGVIAVTRNESAFNSEVSGSWVGDKLTLTRLLDSDSSESMNGIAIALGTEKVNIGGRYSTDFQGVWSADCDLVSQSIISQEQGSSDVQPSTSSRIRPNSPTNKDRITFSTLASHPEGIEKVSFFLGSDEIHSCESDRCEFTYGPIATGVYNWRVEAISINGVKNTEDSNTLSIVDGDSMENCSLSGRATGTSAPLAGIYLVKLYGPDNTNLLKASTGFNNGSYTFSNLSAGQYRLLVDTQGDQEILASPAEAVINCQSQSVLTQNIEFR